MSHTLNRFQPIWGYCIDKSQYQICKHWRRIKTLETIYSETLPSDNCRFPELKSHQSRKDLSTAPNVLKRLHTRSILCSALSNRLPPLTLIALQKLGSSSRKRKTIRFNKPPLIINQLSMIDIDSSWQSTMNYINSTIRSSGLRMTTNIPKLVYRNIYSTLYHDTKTSIKTNFQPQIY